MELLQIEQLPPVHTNGLMKMEQPPFDPPYTTAADVQEMGMDSNPKPFIEANTIPSNLTEIRGKHTIPSFAKDGEPLISHADFIETTMQKVTEVFAFETILNPGIRLSHEIRGRLPSAKDKPANQLLDHERTIFYERMAFVIEIPSIKGIVDGNSLSLMVGGVKNYAADNLYNRAGAEQKFKLFIGFKNSVCTNSCISTDGLLGNVSVGNLAQLSSYIQLLLESFDHNLFLRNLNGFTANTLTEAQFAHMIGRCRMYQHLPKTMQQALPNMQFGETQLGSVVRDYYRDNNFCRKGDGSISLWKLYNLFTGANKSTYIDAFADRAAGAHSFVGALQTAMDRGNRNWFLG